MRCLQEYYYPDTERWKSYQLYLKKNKKINKKIKNKIKKNFFHFLVRVVELSPYVASSSKLDHKQKSYGCFKFIMGSMPETSKLHFEANTGFGFGGEGSGGMGKLGAEGMEKGISIIEVSVQRSVLVCLFFRSFVRSSVRLTVRTPAHPPARPPARP